MKENAFLDGISNIESDVVERFIAMDNQLQKKARKSKPKGIWLRFGAIAACFALIVGAIIAVPMLNGNSPWFKRLPDVPTWDNAQYSAENISKWFDTYSDAVSTNAYTEIYVPDARYLYIDTIPDEEYLGVYQYIRNGNALNKNDFQAFMDGILPKVAASIHAPVPQYEIDEDDDLIRARIKISSYYMAIWHCNSFSSFSLLRQSDSDGKIILDGETVQIDQRLSDEEIINSIQSIKNKLFAIFSVSFTDAKIIRHFNDYGKHGAQSIYIYFYDKHPLNSDSGIPRCYYICIRFDNQNDPGAIERDSILTRADIEYSKNRVDITEEYALLTNAKRISLEDAEALLYNGYVFGGHSCPKCMAAQDKISFEGYDFVDMEYVFGSDPQANESVIGIPFYAFYKKIGTARNGNSIYAKTYVAAIEVSGYDAYFKSQIGNHKSSVDATANE